MYKNHSHWFYNEYSESKGYFEKDKTYVLGSNTHLKKFEDRSGKIRYPRKWFKLPKIKKQTRNIPRSQNEHIVDVINRFNFLGRCLTYKNGIVTKYFSKNNYCWIIDDINLHPNQWPGKDLNEQIEILKKKYPNFILDNGETNSYIYYSYKYILGIEFERWKNITPEKLHLEMYKKIISFLKKEYKKFLPYCKKVNQISDILIDENGLVEKALYGAHTANHIPMQEVIEFSNS